MKTPAWVWVVTCVVLGVVIVLVTAGALLLSTDQIRSPQELRSTDRVEEPPIQTTPMELVQAWDNGTYDERFGGRLVELKIWTQVYRPQRPVGSPGYATGPYVAICTIGSRLGAGVGCVFDKNPGFIADGSDGSGRGTGYSILVRGRCVPTKDLGARMTTPVIDECIAIEFKRTDPRVEFPKGP